VAPRDLATAALVEFMRPLIHAECDGNCCPSVEYRSTGHR
jgi:hypothetical protein